MNTIFYRTFAVFAVVAFSGFSIRASGNEAASIEQAYSKNENLVGVKAMLEAKPKSVIGEEIVYPGGTPAEISAVRITIPPGQKTSWHKHGAPLFAYILSGVLDVDYGDKGTRTFKAGSAFMEAMGQRHRGMNNGTEPVEIVAVYMGAAGVENVIGD